MGTQEKGCHRVLRAWGACPQAKEEQNDEAHNGTDVNNLRALGERTGTSPFFSLTSVRSNSSFGM